MKKKAGRNPFYTLLMVASTLFVVTALGYLMGPFVERRVIEGRAEPSALAGWFERRGVLALAIEFGLMTVLAILAMSTDHLFEPGRPRNPAPTADTKGRGGATSSPLPAAGEGGGAAAG